MDTVKVTYIGSSGRRRARGRTESYWFRPQVSLRIPASDIDVVTGNDPENWLVERPQAERDTLRQDWPTAPATPRRRRGRRKAKANKPTTKTEPTPSGAPVNEE